jgi:hypothetical protein
MLKKIGAETASHLKAKNHIAKQLHAALAKGNTFKLLIADKCINQGIFFKCNETRVSELLRIDKAKVKDIAVLKECKKKNVVDSCFCFSTLFLINNCLVDSENISRFDIAFVDLSLPKKVDDSNIVGNNSNDTSNIANPMLRPIDFSSNPDDSIMFQRLYTQISEYAESSKSTTKPLVLTGLNAYQRRAAHMLCSAYDHLKHESIGEGLTRALFIQTASDTGQRSARKRRQQKETQPYSVLGAVEICHSSPMTDRKVASLVDVPWVEVTANGSAQRWHSNEPLPAARSSLPSYTCARCVHDAAQHSMQFTRVWSIFDVVVARGRARPRVTRHILSQIDDESDGSVRLVSDKLVLTARRWSVARPGRAVLTLPADNVDVEHRLAAHVDATMKQYAAKRTFAIL